MYTMLRARAGALQALNKHLLYYFWYKSVAVCRASLGNSLDHILSVDVYLKTHECAFQWAGWPISSSANHLCFPRRYTD